MRADQVEADATGGPDAVRARIAELEAEIVALRRQLPAYVQVEMLHDAARRLLQEAGMLGGAGA